MRRNKGYSVRAGIVLLVLSAAAVLGCSTTPVRDDTALAGQYQPAGREGIRAMVDSIAVINRKCPESYTLDFDIDGTYGDKKNKLLGSAQYDKKQRAMHVAFVDYIFRSPVMTILREGDTVRVYYPVEKKMFVDSSKTIDLANYGGVTIDFDMFHDIITGSIPLITGYSVKQGLSANDGKGSLLILENPKYFQTISFQGNDPDKILLINKKTREKLEIYVKKPFTQGAGRIYSNIMIVAQGVRLRLDITFKKIRLNAPVKVKTVKDIKLPDNLKVIQM